MNISDRYEIEVNSGGGGMGDIYTCKDLHLDRRVIMKVLKDGQDNRRLLDEQRSLLNLRSKHVVQLFDIVELRNDTDHKLGLILEYIDGVDLSAGEYSQDLSFIHIMWQVSCGLFDIHSSGIIHRDIKPNNIKIDDRGVVKILDFGLARDQKEAQTKCIIGTQGYMAPELWKSGVVGFSSAIDVYAFGVMALVLLGIKLPDSIVEIPPSSISQGSVKSLLSGLPSEISLLIEKCLSFDKNNRPSIEEVENNLRKYLLKDKHRALIVLGAKTFELNSNKRQVALNHGADNTISIKYDGFWFSVGSVMGSVSINNRPVQVDQKLPAACVITFGTGSSRAFTTFDVSNPEVIS